MRVFMVLKGMLIVGNCFSSSEPSKGFTKKKLTMLDTMRENKPELFPNI
jgi:hypothetical protein